MWPAAGALPREARWLVGAFLALSLLRLAVVPAIDLMPQDAYYATYAETPGLSYYEHPPLLGWSLWLTTAVLGETTVGVRATPFLYALGTQGLLLLLALRLLPPDRALRGTLLWVTAPLATVTSLVTTPDAPLLFSWALALLLLERALFADPRPWRWPLAGGAMGLAFLSKYTAVLLPVGLAFFLLASPRQRPRLARPGPWVALATMQLVSLPVYLWNQQQGWVSFRFQFLDRAAAVSGFEPRQLAGFAIAQALMLLPLPLAALIARLTRSTGRLLLRRSLADDRLFLVAFALPLLLVCVAVATTAWVKANWPLPAYLAGVLLAASALPHRWLRPHLLISGAVHLLLLVQLLAYPVPLGSDDTWFGWQRLGREVETLAAAEGAAFVFALDSYKTTAELRFYTDLPAFGWNALGCPALHLSALEPEPERFRGTDALLVRSERRLRPSERTDLLLEAVAPFFERVEELEPVAIERWGRTMRLFRIFRAEGYRGPEARRRGPDPCVLLASGFDPAAWRRETGP